MKRREFLSNVARAGALSLPSVSAFAAPCPPSTLGVDGGTSVTTLCSSTPLQTLAQSMAAGTWAKLTPANSQNPVLGVGSISGSMLHYCNTMPWNPVARAIELVGMDHNYPSMRHARYMELSNSFMLVSDNAGLGQGHGYDHNAVNPTTGDLYHRLYGAFTGKIQTRKKAYGAASFTNLPEVSGAEQVAIGACWWSGAFPGAGSQGCFMIFNSGSSNGTAADGQIVAYDPLTNNWFYNQTSRSPNFYDGSNGTYHSLIEYSTVKNVVVYGGGNSAGSKLWRMTSNGTVTAMPNVPAGKGVGVQRGILVNDPVTGNFLLLSAGELWELDPNGAGTWTQLTGSRVPPAEVGIPGPTTVQAVIASAISDYGVVGFITQPNQNGGSFYLYKHA